MALLFGKVAIVTGAGNGIGRAHALYLAQAGAQVVVNDLGGTRDGAGASKAADVVVQEITAAGGKAVAHYESISTYEGAQTLIWTALNRFGRVDVLVNNAGILRDKTLLNMGEADFDKVVEVHLKGSYLCLQAAARQMKLAGRGGRIINTTSMSGLLGNFGQGNYSAAKAGIFGLTRTASMEFQKAGITVNAIAPVALTRMTTDLPVMAGMSEDDLGPQHIAPLVGFLASDLSAEVTGRIFGVQGRRIFEYKMEQSDGVTKDTGTWTPEEVKAQLEQIGRF
ncbi:MAG: SDR family NAD(P)-dependent oxidoreductase [Deltaproteobacteria bacterium]|nr:SDR family NAD(P)-dependent oxidoreductase [Deltaproteobacteria bacterium]